MSGCQDAGCENTCPELAQEETVRERVDANGNRWMKVYFGSGEHFRNWLSQTVELKGEENVEVEEIDRAGLLCFEDSGGKAYRIWVRENDAKD